MDFDSGEMAAAGWVYCTAVYRFTGKSVFTMGSSENVTQFPYSVDVRRRIRISLVTFGLDSVDLKVSERRLDEQRIKALRSQGAFFSSRGTIKIERSQEKGCKARRCRSFVVSSDSSPPMHPHSIDYRGTCKPRRHPSTF